MQRILLMVVLFAFATFSEAAEPPSKTDTKYKNRSQALYAKFDEARELLDSWRGQRELLSRAQQLLTEVTQVDTKFAPAYREFGRLYIMSGYISEDNVDPQSLARSEAVILKAIEIEPDYADAYVLLGHLYTNMRRYADASAALTKGEKIGTASPWLQLNWADLLTKQGDHEGAFQRNLAVAKGGTENKKALSAAVNGVILYYKVKGRMDEADEWYKKTVANDPSSAWAWGNYASFQLFFRGDVDGAIGNAEKALSIMNYGMGRYVLACALYAKWASAVDKNAVQAQALYDRAYQMYPNVDGVIEETRKFTSTKYVATKLAERKQRLQAQPKSQLAS